MMVFVGLFMGGAPGALIASGQAVLNLQWSAQDPKDTPGASFTVSSPGFNKTIQADTSGRGYVTVPVGDYTVSVTHNGVYNGDEPQTVKAESQKSYIVMFNGTVNLDIVNSWKESSAPSEVVGYELFRQKIIENKPTVEEYQVGSLSSLKSRLKTGDLVIAHDFSGYDISFIYAEGTRVFGIDWIPATGWNYQDGKGVCAVSSSLGSIKNYDGSTSSASDTVNGYIVKFESRRI